MHTYAVIYEYEPQLLSLIDNWRPAHRTYLRDLHKQGKLFTSGHLRDSAHAGALLIMRTDSAQEARELLEQDPFFKHGLVTNIIVREWKPTIGDLAERFSNVTDFPISNP
ncbi:MAG: YciI family protein [Actinomycetaceae bacterium]|nr:YciI family protein [Actinomycetaceae bacterium]